MLLGYEGLGAGFCIFCLYSIMWFISCAHMVVRLKLYGWLDQKGCWFGGFGQSVCGWVVSRM